MIYMINADGRIEPEEIRRLVIAVRDDRVLLEVATRYTKFNTVEHFLEECSVLLDHEQKLAVLVNLYDAILANGEALPQELELFERFMGVFGFNDAEFDPYFNSIVVKNNKALFGKS
jgi:predicted TIM-barrel fold metal-dependent hydrolase